MPRNIERDKREADRRKNQLIEAGFRLFSQNGIETVSLQKVADAANVSPATMYKYFLTKEKLLIAISAKVWDEVWQEALGDPGTNHFEHFTAYQGIEFYADRMIALYKNRPEVLRFSGEYKTYMQTILPPSGNTIKILGKARSAEHGLRWMTYVLAQPVEGGVLVFHTLTRALLLLTPEEYAAPDNPPELRSSWFRVPQEIIAM